MYLDSGFITAFSQLPAAPKNYAVSQNIKAAGSKTKQMLKLKMLKKKKRGNAESGGVICHITHLIHCSCKKNTD